MTQVIKKPNTGSFWRKPTVRVPKALCHVLKPRLGLLFVQKRPDPTKPVLHREIAEFCSVRPRK
jgi:hypothetical protein